MGSLRDLLGELLDDPASELGIGSSWSWLDMVMESRKSLWIWQLCMSGNIRKQNRSVESAKFIFSVLGKSWGTELVTMVGVTVFRGCEQHLTKVQHQFKFVLFIDIPVISAH
jgi:hypothetical protein